MTGCQQLMQGLSGLNPPRISRLGSAPVCGSGGNPVMRHPPARGSVRLKRAKSPWLWLLLARPRARTCTSKTPSSPRVQ